MGVYIKGMEMPKSCADCELAEHYERYGQEHYCPFMGWYADYEKCPLIPVPPHGDLIERDAAYDKIAEQEGGNYVDMDAVDMGLNETPTIIPAEESE